MKYTSVLLITFCLISCSHREPLGIANINEASDIALRVCLSSDTPLLFKHTDFSGLSSRKTERLKEQIENYFRSKLFNNFTDSNYDIKVIPFDKFNPYEGYPDDIKKRFSLTPQVWNIKPDKIIQIKGDSENRSGKASFGVFNRNNQWYFSVAYKEDLLPKDGTAGYPFSEKKLLKKRSDKNKFNFVESFGSHTGPYKYIGQNIIPEGSNERFVMLKDAVEEYRVNLEFIPIDCRILVELYEDQFSQSRIEVFQSD